jgi:hypothetical protein
VVIIKVLNAESNNKDVVICTDRTQEVVIYTDKPHDEDSMTDLIHKSVKGSVPKLVIRVGIRMHNYTFKNHGDNTPAPLVVAPKKYALRLLKALLKNSFKERICISVMEENDGRIT